MSIFEQWDNSIDVEALAREVKEIKKNGGTGNFPEVPVGKYEVKIDNMEVKKSSKGNYMFAAQFRILAGEHENQCLFMYQVITKGWQIATIIEFLESLEINIDKEIEFINYNQFNDLVMDIKEELDKVGTEYVLEYKKSKNNYSVYTIKEVFHKNLPF